MFPIFLLLVGSSPCFLHLPQSKAANGGGVQTGRFPIWTRPSRFVLFCPFWDFPDFCGIFPICPGIVPICPFPLSRPINTQLRGTVPKGSATQSGPFTKKMGNPPVWKPPGLASPNLIFSSSFSSSSASSQQLSWRLSRDRRQDLCDRKR